MKTAARGMRAALPATVATIAALTLVLGRRARRPPPSARPP